MGKVTDLGPAPKDSPLFKGGAQLFTVQRNRPTSRSSPPDLPDAPVTDIPEILLGDAAVARFERRKPLARPIARTKPSRKNKAPKVEPEHWFQIHWDDLIDMPGRCESFTESYRRLSLTEFEYRASGTEFDGTGEVETIETFNSIADAAYFVLNLDSAERPWEANAPLAGPRCVGLLAASRKAGWPDMIHALRELEKEYRSEDE